MKKKNRILCLDIEGGHGGSSRSLYHTLNNVDKSVINAEVWCKKRGKIKLIYEDMGINCKIYNNMPKVSSLPKNSRNIYAFFIAFFDFLRAKKFRRALLEKARNDFDLIHFNHEALFLLAAYLKPKVKIPLTMHIRTNLKNTIFARWQTSIISKNIDHLIFITENEQINYKKLGGDQQGSVIYNIVKIPEKIPEPYSKISNELCFKIAVLSNYSWLRGIDRLIDLAMEMQKRKRKDIVFIVAGDLSLSKSLPGELGKIGKNGGTLKEYADLKNVSDYFIFLGHVPEPERVLAGCNMLIKPTRENNPWGRDILEGMSFGLPVASVGTFNTFVEDGITGILQSRYDPHTLVDAILKIADNTGYCHTLGVNAIARVEKLCSGHNRAADITKLWQQLIIANIA
jgi:glycosyltransferase involved in cell wall biosynthesis